MNAHRPCKSHAIGAGVAIATALALTFAATACSSGSSSNSATTTTTVTVTPSPPTTAQTQPATTTAPPTTHASSRCGTSELSGSINSDTGGGTAGGYEVALVLTNTGSRTCTIEGYPGVSFVGDGNGTQLGAAARRGPGTPVAPVRLAPGTSVTSSLLISEAGNYDSATCRPSGVDGFRVYPPDNTASLFIRYPQPTACRSAQVSLLTVDAVH